MTAAAATAVINPAVNQSRTGGREMKYLVSWSVPQPAARAAIERFLKTGGAPPEGVTQVGRWFGMNGKGCSIVEASDPKGVFALVSEWQEFIEIEATPVMEDEDAAAVLAKLYG
jgi:Protein of unknown function (DUF3303)